VKVLLRDCGRTFAAELGIDLRTRGAPALPDLERALLKEFNGIGDIAVNIFFREAQVAWPELFPFIDAKAAESAAKLGLQADPQSLAALVRTKTKFSRLTAALVRVQLSHKHEEVIQAAARDLRQKRLA